MATPKDILQKIAKSGVVKKAAVGAATGGLAGGALRAGFKLGSKVMAYDRGRYKESGNVGSVNESKGPGFLRTVKVMTQTAGEGAKMLGKQGAEMGKAIGATIKAKQNLAREKGIADKQDAARANKSKASGMVKKAFAAGSPKSIGGALAGRAKTISDIEKQYK